MPPAALPLNEADRLAALRSYRILDTPREDTFDNLVRLAARLSGCPTALVTLVDENRQWFKACHGWEGIETTRDMSFGAHVILHPWQPLVVDDARFDIRFADNPLVAGWPGIRFYAGMPLTSSEGFALGTVCIIDYAPREISPGIIETIALLAQAVMSTLELGRTTERLQTMAHENADRFAHLVEALPAALVLSCKIGRIRLINREAERMFGYERSELRGQSVEMLLPERFRLGHVGLRQGFLANMSARVMGEGRSLFGQRKDGSEFPLEIGLSPIDFHGEAMALTVIVNIASRQKIELEREQQKLELQRSNAELQEFAYAASHDLKAPLRAIAHLATWIREDIEPTAAPDTMDNLTLLQGRARRLQMLLDGLLAYSRLGRTDDTAEDLDITTVVCDVVAVLDLPPGFVVACEGPMPQVRTHRAPIEMVLKNLISNGLQHHDRVEGRITVSMRLLDGLAEFSVSDDGPGIAKQFHERIFAIFQTLTSRDNAESSGIGLAIAKKKIESNGGRIWVVSAPPARGATFVFTWRVTAP